MATTQFGTDDPRTQKKWSKLLFKHALDRMFFTQRGMLGVDENSVIMVDKNLTKEKGDKINFEMQYPLTGDGQGDDGAIETNNEALTIANFLVTVHERAHSVASAGKMSAQRTATNIRKAGKAALGNWMGQIMEQDIYNALAGLYNVSTSIATVNEAAPSTNRKFIGGYSLAGTGPNSYGTLASVLATNLDDAAQMNTRLISLIKRKAIMASPRFRPIRIKGEDFFVMLLHTLQIKSIKAETGDRGWTAIQKDAAVRGKDNPLFSGAAGLWDGVILQQYDKVATCTGAGSSAIAEGFQQNATLASRTSDAAASGVSFARALFLGAQAGALAYAQLPAWYEKMLDLGRKPAVGTDVLYGAAKTRFNKYTQPSGGNTAQEDFAAYTVDTAVFTD